MIQISMSFSGETMKAGRQQDHVFKSLKVKSLSAWNSKSSENMKISFSNKSEIKISLDERKQR